MAETNLAEVVPSPQLDIFSEGNLQLLDETVREVFSVQFGMDVLLCVRANATNDTAARRNEQTALIGFAGALTGMCELRLSIAASVAVTQAMLPDTVIVEGSDWICDAVGELCNLLAGGWKNRLPQLGAGCSLTPPTVIAGEQYEVHRPASLQSNRRTYSFGGQHLLVLTLIYDPEQVLQRK